VLFGFKEINKMFILFDSLLSFCGKAQWPPVQYWRLGLWDCLDHIWYVCPFGENLFAPNIYFNDFDIFIYFGPRPSSEFFVQQ